MSRVMYAVFLATALCCASASAQIVSTPDASVPIKIRECENNQCVDWIFQGKNATFTWPDGAVSNLEISWAFFPSVSIRRQDISGPSHGLVATYSGSVRSNRIDGTINFSWPIPKVVLFRYKPKPTTGKWSATIANPADLALALGIVQTSCETPTGRQPVTGAQAMAIGAAAARLRQNENAVQCFYKAAIQGNMAAQNALGFAYEKGIGTLPDLNKAAALYKQAAEAGSQTGRENLINLYRNPAAAGLPREKDAIDRLTNANKTQMASLNQYCSSPAFLKKMDDIGCQEIQDRNVYAMRLLALAIGVGSNNPEPRVWFSRALPARQAAGDFLLDIAGENNEFVCVSTFIRGDTELRPTPDAEASAEISALLIDKLLKAVPYYREWFRISPRPDQSYIMTLVPNGIELSRPFVATVPRDSDLEPRPDRLFLYPPEVKKSCDANGNCRPLSHCSGAPENEMKPAPEVARTPADAPKPSPTGVGTKLQAEANPALTTSQILAHALHGDLEFLRQRFSAGADQRPVTAISARLTHLSHCADEVEVHKVSWQGTPPGYVALGACDEGRPRLWMILDTQGKISQVGFGSILSGKSPEQIKQRARDLVGLLIHARLADFRGSLTPQAQSQNDLQPLKRMDQVKLDFGEFRSIFDVQLDHYSDVATVTCDYAKGRVNFELAFDPALKVSNWSVQSASAPRRIPQEFADLR